MKTSSPSPLPKLGREYIQRGFCELVDWLVTLDPAIIAIPTDLDDKKFLVIEVNESKTNQS